VTAVQHLHGRQSLPDRHNVDTSQQPPVCHGIAI